MEYKIGKDILIFLENSYNEYSLFLIIEKMHYNITISKLLSISDILIYLNSFFS